MMDSSGKTFAVEKEEIFPSRPVCSLGSHHFNVIIGLMVLVSPLNFRLGDVEGCY